MKQPAIFNFRFILPVLFLLVLFGSCQTDDDTNWMKGNMHTHTFWSDGDDFPEPVAKWYKDHGYDFLAFTDHNVILEGERWRSFPKDHQALAKYTGLFGEEWVETRPAEEEGHVQVKLKPLDAFRDRFEEPGDFLLMMGNEITARHAVHMLAHHQDEVIPKAEGSVDEKVAMIQKTIERLEEYRQRTGRNTHPVLAHPNFQWAITAEMMLKAEDLRYFEVYNGHPAVNNEGDKLRASTERIWDIVLSKKLANGNENILYGLATDDAHNYHSGGATPGKGWVMVNSRELTPENILDAIDRGDFYASSGVTLKEIHFDGERLEVEIKPQDGVEYTTEYIGTRSGFDAGSKTRLDESGSKMPNTTQAYSEDIGEVLASSTELKSGYTFTGDELYVRVRITSSANQKDQITGEVIGKQRAWIQPVVPGITKAYR
ncbi:MAG: hypothetical protein V5A47_13145 [Bacteroidales bacterium]|nr:hypothetical protein [Bacteroidales bacterium]